MRLRFLGKETEAGNSPSLYDTGQGMYVVQGWEITDPEALAQLALPAGETAVLVPYGLMRYLPEEGHETPDS